MSEMADRDALSGENDQLQAEVGVQAKLAQERAPIYIAEREHIRQMAALPSPFRHTTLPSRLHALGRPSPKATSAKK